MEDSDSRRRPAFCGLWNPSGSLRPVDFVDPCAHREGPRGLPRTGILSSGHVYGNVLAEKKFEFMRSEVVKDKRTMVLTFISTAPVQDSQRMHGFKSLRTLSSVSHSESFKS